MSGQGAHLASGETPLHLLHRVWGHTAFRGQQAQIVERVLAGGSGLVLMPTGGGKSLCYQLPAILRPGVGLVISPLIALMQDQVAALRQNGVEAAFLNSSLDAQAKAEVRRRAREGRLQLLYVAPETLTTGAFQSFVQELPLSLIAVDEAHCVSQWGHDFRPDYLEVARLRELFPAVPLLALTATADPATRREILQRLGLEQDPVFASSFDRPNINYRITLKQGGREQLLDFLRAEHQGDAGIVYVLSRAKTEETAAFLEKHGLTALPYHAGLPAEERRQNQERFLRDDGVIVVATIAFGMGIDKPDVRFVAHLDMPKSVEGYYQETGRAGRDGEPATAWMAYSLGDVVQLRQLIGRGEGDEAFKRLATQKLNAMLGLAESPRCRRQALLGYFGEEHPGGCGSCDNCLQPPRQWDATVAAQKALSAVFRTGQRFGAAHLIDVLLGKPGERAASLGHDQLSVWGVGKELDEQRWSSVFRQLVAADLLSVDPEGFGGFALNPRSWPVLKGQQLVSLREDVIPAKARRRRGAASGAGGRADPAAPGSQGDRIFEALRALRLELARAQGVAPFIIFHDKTLREIAARRPATLAGLAEVPGLGEVKLQRYGEQFLAALRQALASG